MSDPQTIRAVLDRAGLGHLAAQVEERRQEREAQGIELQPWSPPRPRIQVGYQPPAKSLTLFTDHELEEAVANCGNCYGLGVVGYEVDPGHPNFGKLDSCPQCRRYTREQRRRKVVAELGSIIERFSTLAGDLTTKTFAAYQRKDGNLDSWTAARQWAGAILDKAEYTPWLYLWGAPGCGKTHLAAAAANGLLSQGIPLIFVNMINLKGMISSNNWQHKEALTNALQRVPVLIIDDVGQEAVSDWSRELLFTILDHRYTARLPLMITSNHPPQTDYEHNIVGVDEVEGQRIASRLMDRTLSTVVLNAGSDYRKG